MPARLFVLLGLFVAASAAGETAFAPFEKNAVIDGKLAADPECLKDRRNPQVWLSIGQILLYQVEVPVDGSYEFHVVPGKYDLAATTSKGCLAEAELTVTPTQVAQADLRLAPARAPAGKGNRK